MVYVFMLWHFVYIVVIQSPSRVWLSAIPWTAASQASLSFTISQSLLKLMTPESGMPSNHLILCCARFLLLPFPASGSFPVNQFFTSGDQSIGPSASVLPMNNQDWFLFGWTGWISSQYKGLSRVFSNSTVQKHQFFGAQLSTSWMPLWASVSYLGSRDAARTCLLLCVNLESQLAPPHTLKDYNAVAPHQHQRAWRSQQLHGGGWGRLILPIWWRGSWGWRWGQSNVSQA